MRFALWICFCLLFWIELLAQNHKKFPVWIKKHECTEQPYLVSKILECKLDSYRDKPQEISMVMELLEPQRRVFLTFTVFMQHQRTRSALYGTTMDVCKVLEDAKAGTNKVAEVIVEVARKNFPQILKPCPYEGVLNATGISMDSNMVLPYTLPGAYRTEVRLYNKRNQTIVAWNTDFEMQVVNE